VILTVEIKCQLDATYKTIFTFLQHKIPQAATTVNTLELLMMGIVMPETC